MKDEDHEAEESRVVVGRLLSAEHERLGGQVGRDSLQVLDPHPLEVPLGVSAQSLTKGLHGHLPDGHATVPLEDEAVDDLVAVKLLKHVLEVPGLVLDVALDHQDPVEVILQKDPHRPADGLVLGREAGTGQSSDFSRG